MSNCLAIFFVLEPVFFGNIVGLVVSFTLLYFFGDFVKGGLEATMEGILLSLDPI